MENNRENASAQTETEFEPISLVCDILKNWWVILFGALAGAMLFYVASSMIYVPNYRTQATFVITSRENANAYNNLSSANSMAETFQKILESTIMKKTICEKLDMDKLDADISANVVKGTNMLTLSVTAHSPKDSIDIIKIERNIKYNCCCYIICAKRILKMNVIPAKCHVPFVVRSSFAPKGRKRAY